MDKELGEWEDEAAATLSGLLSSSDDVSVAVLEILHGHPIPPMVKHTLVALIPRNQRPEGDQKIHWINASHLCKSKNDGGLGFQDMGIFNGALAKQVWRLLKDGNLLVARLLRTRYYLHGDLFNASLGIHPSFTWRSLMDARQVVLCGSRWLVGDGSLLNVWDDRWLSRPLSFKPVTPKPIEWSNIKVSDLIDRDSASWKTELVRQIFLECDIELILSIPLCDSWPTNNLIRHHHPQDLFSIHSAYHMLVSNSIANAGSSSNHDNSLW
ncbi:hypothetical protein Cgig2_027674 [Carnegiea gigantea]|uniref:Uncharacterized protein n=1 Tax=Carnegiea gigantea TaxID=171969 RepID=A0A9Q1JQS7_9CARY|nr:hypothetical protein Cgig2_027674 [Carnegiea gigantea]